MKKHVLILWAVMLAVNAFCVSSADITFATYSDNQVRAYKDRLLVATCTDSATFFQALSLSSNSAPVIQAQQLAVGSTWVALPGPAAALKIATHSHGGANVALCYNTVNDSLYLYQGTMPWYAEKAGVPAGMLVNQVDVGMYGDTIMLGIFFENSGMRTVGYRSLGSTINGGITPDSTVYGFNFIWGSPLTVTTNDTSVLLDNSVVIESRQEFDWMLDNQKACNADWCIYTSRAERIDTGSVGYLWEPQHLGFDDGVFYTQYNLQFAAIPSCESRFICGLDRSVDTTLLPKIYFMSLTKRSGALFLGGHQQRFFMNRIVCPQDRGDLSWFGYSMNLGREARDSSIEILTARSGGPTGSLVQFDRKGSYVKSWRIPDADSHDYAVYGAYSVGIGYYPTDSSYWQPPLIIKEGVGIDPPRRWMPLPGGEFPPLKKDSCAVAQSSPLMGNHDWHHTNGLDLFPSAQGMSILLSARHIAPWPESWPLCAWIFRDSTGARIDHRLTYLMNSTPFGIGRRGGHDVQVEWNFSKPGRWLLSQYDNVVCDANDNPSYAHTAILTQVDTTWEMTDFRSFEGTPSTSQGSVSVKMYGRDTLVGINGGGINTYYGILQHQPLTIRNYSTGLKVAGVSFDYSGAYQANLVGQEFEKPGFKAHLEISGTDSFSITVDSLPAGTWCLWLGNKQITQGSVYTFPVAPIIQQNGLTVYISGTYSESDTLPDMPQTWLGNRWVSDPVWLELQSTTSGVDKVAEEIWLAGAYPNPGSRFTLTCSSPDEWAWEIYSLTGQQLLSGTNASPVADLSSFPNGVYTAHVKTTSNNNRKIKSLKLIKL